MMMLFSIQEMVAIMSSYLRGRAIHCHVHRHAVLKSGNFLAGTCAVVVIGLFLSIGVIAFLISFKDWIAQWWLMSTNQISTTCGISRGLDLPVNCCVRMSASACW
jgi:hypothetical protein